ncbi:MAG: hypothetical protein H7328_04715 [Bdellovibrio sp.]|nr:hypothetical protein [Bdellovibrio sp.]
MKAVSVTCVLFLVASLSCYAVQSDDLFMYLALAKNFFMTGSFATHDLFLYTLNDYSWTIMHQWLGYLSFYGLYELGGYNLIIIAKTSLIGFFLTFYVLTKKSSQFSLFIWGTSVALAMYAMSFRLMERTSLFSDFLIVSVLYILVKENEKPSRIKYILPILFLFWVNLHPAFPIGWALCFLFLLCNFKKIRNADYTRFAAVTAASILVCLLNPKGLDGLLYPFQFATNEGAVFRQYYFEWMPTLNSMFLYQPQTLFLGLLILFNLFLIFKTRKTKPRFEFLASLFFIAYGLYAIRFVPTLCFALVFLNFSLSLRLADLKIAKKFNYALAFIALVLAVKNISVGYDVISGHRDFGLGLDSTVVPQKAANILLKNPQIGNVFNSHMFGSYLAWTWRSERKIFYHGFVTDTNLFLNEYAAFSLGTERFNRQVEKYKIEAFLLDRFRGNEPLINTLVSHPHWQLAYKDESSLIFLKK